jgi:hypothetical protein
LYDTLLVNVLHVFETCLLDISGLNMYRVSSTKTACPRAQLCAVKKNLNRGIFQPIETTHGETYDTRDCL